MSFADELKQRIETTRKQWEKARKDAREAKDRESTLYTHLTALQRVHDAEVSRMGKGKQPEALVSVVSAPSAAGNKTETIRELIRNHSPAGLTPAQIREKLRQASVDLNDTYVYSVLLRSKRRGLIEEKNGRYFTVEGLKTEAAG